MHLLLAEKGSITEGDEAIDLGQSPGDVVFLSAADTDLSALAAAIRAEALGLRFRLVNLSSLRHPMSVDRWIERTGRHAKTVIVRALGGRAYFSYLVEALQAASARHGFSLALLPGDDRADPDLASASTVSGQDLSRLHGLFVEGGPSNMARLVRLAARLAGQDGEDDDGDVEPLLKAGIYWPGEGVIGLDAWQALRPDEGRPVAVIAFYRALVQSGQTAPIDALVTALAERGLDPLPLFVASLKDPVSVDTVRAIFLRHAPSVVLNATSFAVAAPGAQAAATVLDETGSVVLQLVLSSSTQEAWQASSQGLNSRDLAMNVALPEVDGRILSRAISFKSANHFDADVEANIVVHAAHAERIGFVADMACNWARLRATPPDQRKVALVMANYPNRDGRLGNGVGLDTPAGTIRIIRALEAEGYAIANAPADGDSLMDHLMAGPTNAARDGRLVREVLSFSDYNAFFATLPVQIQDEVTARWGGPEADPYADGDRFALPLTRFGALLVGIQPARGYNIDPKSSYHDPALVPPHGYLAFYAWLRRIARVDAVIHMGKHGNLEWLPGKALALDRTCYPEAIFGPMPHLYPFIVNDPGEGTQAKRRNSAVIIDHLTPPLTRAESYGALKDLEALVDEFYQAQGNDPRRVDLLRRQILDLARDTGLAEDAGLAGASGDDALVRLDAWLCDLKELQIRDGLHVFGQSPQGRLRTDLVTAIARLPRGDGEGARASLHRALSADLFGLERDAFDPLDCAMAEAWEGPRPDGLASLSPSPWRSKGDTVERLELLAARLVAGEIEPDPDWSRTVQVMKDVSQVLAPAIDACGPAEIASLLQGLSGRFVLPGSSGAPSRGRADVLPTGKNFYSVDCRAVPTPTAWELGRKSAELLVTRYVQDHGDWPTSLALTAWGTSNMRTGGDDIAQALALLGVKPVWDTGSWRVTGYEIIPLARLGRPRVDVTLRISGFFRDAFPDQIALFDKAVRAVAALEEDEADNPLAARTRRSAAAMVEAGTGPDEARRLAAYRVFGAMPGAYGAGLQALIDEKGWEKTADLGEAFVVWGGYAYGAGTEGKAAHGLFRERLAGVDAVIQNQDNREHDLLDSDDYYQFEGGMSAAVQMLSGQRPAIYHNDHSRPERPVIRSLEEEIGRVVRGRVVNPKWIAGVMRHGYKGAFEITATVDYMFAFAATTGAVRDHHFDAAYQAFLADDAVRDFMAEKNAPALRELAGRFLEAIDRGLWTPKSNSARFHLEQLT